MRIYDISQEIFSCSVYQGDPKPEKQTVCSMNKGDLYNLTSFSMCAHNGTHMDAPSHFIKDGDTIDMIPLEKTVGMAYVASCSGDLDGKAIERIIRKAENENTDSKRRILIKGKAELTESGAEALVKSGAYLIGVESQSVGPEASPMEVHKILLGDRIVILEGLRLDAVADGVYLLCAQPLNLGGSDGAPVRAILVDFGK